MGMKLFIVFVLLVVACAPKEKQYKRKRHAFEREPEASMEVTDGME